MDARRGALRLDLPPAGLVGVGQVVMDGTDACDGDDRGLRVALRHAIVMGRSGDVRTKEPAPARSPRGQIVAARNPRSGQDDAKTVRLNGAARSCSRDASGSARNIGQVPTACQTWAPARPCRREIVERLPGNLVRRRNHRHGRIHPSGVRGFATHSRHGGSRSGKPRMSRRVDNSSFKTDSPSLWSGSLPNSD